MSGRILFSSMASRGSMSEPLGRRLEACLRDFLEAKKQKACSSRTLETCAGNLRLFAHRVAGQESLGSLSDLDLAALRSYSQHLALRPSLRPPRWNRACGSRFSSAWDRCEHPFDLWSAIGWDRKHPGGPVCLGERRGGRRAAPLLLRRP